MEPTKVETRGLSAEGCLRQAFSRLDKALVLEDKGKPVKFVDFMLDRAGQFENAAFDGRE